MSNTEFTPFPRQPNVLLELQKLHAVSVARQVDLINRLDKLIAGQQEQNQLLQQLVQAISSRP